MPTAIPAATPKPAGPVPTTQQIEADAEALRRLQFDRKRLVTTAEQQQPPEWVQTAQPIIFGINTLVPKTRETVGLLDRVLFNDVALQSTLSRDARQSAYPRAARARIAPDAAGPQHLVDHWLKRCL